MVVPCSVIGASVANGAASIPRGLDKRLELICHSYSIRQVVLN